MLVMGGLLVAAAQRGAVAEDVSLLRAQAVRAAVQRIADSIVSVERVGLAGSGGGELADDAPTSAVAIDDERHFIASSLAAEGDAATILLVSPSGQRSVASVVARDHGRQLVLLRAEQSLNVPPLPQATDDVSVGQTVIAVGRRSDQTLTISQGILSATGRNWGLALQTDARVSAAHYGGLLIDLYGRPLGVIVPMVPDGGAPEDTSWYDSGVAFAIDLPSLSQRLETLRGGNDIRPGVAGIVATGSDPYVESSTIAAVRPRSPADAAGLLPGDEVTAINDVAIRSHREIKQTLGPLDAGTSIQVTVKRGEETLTVPLQLTDTIPPLVLQRLGILASERGDDSDHPIVVTAVLPGSPADGRLQVGDRIADVDGTAAERLEAFRRQVLLADPEQPLSLGVVRAGQRLPALEIQTTSIGWLAADQLPQRPEMAAAEAWTVRPWSVADLANWAVVIAPPVAPAAAEDAAGGEDAERPAAELPSERVASEETADLGLLVVLMPPGSDDLQDQATEWQAAAQAAGVVVCLVTAVDSARWTPDEIDVARRLAASLRQNFAIDSAKQAISGHGPGATLALAAAMIHRGTFAGLAIDSATTPPRIRLRENDPAAPLQLLITGEAAAAGGGRGGPSQSGGPSDSGGPGESLLPWQRALRSAGYPLLLGSDQPAAILSWVRSLAVI